MTTTAIRSVLFDAFGTLVIPRSPVPNQYAAVAHKYGLHVDPESVKSAFKIAFSACSQDTPLYGKDYDHWWSRVIQKTFQELPLAQAELGRALPDLTQELLTRFSSKEGYRLHDDVQECLQDLLRKDYKLGAVSNSDPRIIDVLKSLEIIPQLIPEDNISLSWAVKQRKPHFAIFEDALRRVDTPAARTLHIGDDYEEDYQGAKAAGIHALLLDRDGQHPDCKERIKSLGEIPRYLETGRSA